MKKRIIWLLALLLLLQPLSCLTVFAEQAELSVTYVNPLYAGEITQEEVRALEHQPPAESSSGTRHSTIADAAEDMRAQMKQRKSPIVLTLSTTQAVTENTLKQIANEALAHTGVPTEGDYLAYQYASWNATTSSSYDMMGYAYKITYYVTYYTTAAQEAQVDTRVKSALSSLNLTGLSRSQKIQKIYDYICNSVNYDYNLSSNLCYTAYGALYNGKAVCQGYAVLLYRMLLASGIDNRIISGISTANGSPVAHAWNIIQIGNYYYNADVTWDDALNTRAYYLRCNANFAAHYRDSEYSTSAFNSEYPMSPKDYTGGPDEETVAGFTDVLSSAYYAKPVVWAVQHGIAKGMTTTEFWPESDCTRGQIVTFLWRAEGSPAPSSSYSPFTDVDSGKYYYKPMLWAVQKGITKGMTATTFCPDLSCTRGQAVTFLWRAKNKPMNFSASNPFTDVQPNSYYYYPVLWAVSKKITNGMTATGFWPDYNCTRGQIVTFLYRAYGN